MKTRMVALLSLLGLVAFVACKKDGTQEPPRADLSKPIGGDMRAVNQPPGMPPAMPPGMPPGTPPGMAPQPPQIPPPPDVAAPPADAERRPSGLATKLLKPGTGKEKPGEADNVSVNITGWTSEGIMFESTARRGQPATFPLGRVFPGLSEAVGMMTVGEKRRFWMPQNLTFKGQPGRPPGTLVFEIELVSFKAGPKPVPAPADVAAAPGDVEKTKSGLASKVLEKGKGAKKPAPTSKVEVHYTGWTTDGKMFDSSVARGQPAQFTLNGVIPGWTEGLQLMVEGERRRFWIPVELAYKNQPGRPAGMLVFDVQLLKVLSD